MTTAPTLTLDFKKNRIRLYKSALKTLGMPKRILFLIDPSAGILAVKAANSNPKEQAVSVSANCLNGEDSCDTYSLLFMSRLRPLGDFKETKASYTVTGYFAEDNTVAVFPLNSAVLIREGDNEQ